MRIKVAFVDFWTTVNKEEFILVKALKEHHEVEILDNPEEADYVFFSVFGDEHWSLPDRCVKIFYTGENICPDFNACDYAFGFEWMDYGDRYMRLPNYLATPFFKKPTLLMEQKHLMPVPEKDAFCSFVVSNGEGNPIRRQLFEGLSKYKQVDSGGRWLNNVGGPVPDKLAFESRHKFAIACENSSHTGYTTEKLVEAFAAGCVPIYWGDPEVTKVFNPKAFINVHDFATIDELVSTVRALDNDDDAYQSMLQEPALLRPERDSLDVNYQRVIDFMDHIVDQPLEKAVRHNREFWGKKYQERELRLLRDSKKSWKQKLVEQLKNKIKK